MSHSLTEAEIGAIARNPNVTAAVEALACEYAGNQSEKTRTKRTLEREKQLLTAIDKAVWIAVEDAIHDRYGVGAAPWPWSVAKSDRPAKPSADIRPVVGGAGGAAGPRTYIGRDTTVKMPIDGRAKPGMPYPTRSLGNVGRLVYDDPPGSDGDGKAWWGTALADGWTADPICRDTEADAGVCEPHRDVCDNWSAAFPLSAPDGVCGGGR